MGLRASVLIFAGFVAACAETTPPPRPPPEPVPETKPIALEPPPPPPTHIVAGPIAIDLVVSRTAQLFTIVDHLSQWSPFCHPQYAKWAQTGMPLDDDDRASLAKHARIRRVRGWGSGLEVAFDVPQELDDATAAAVESKLVSAEDALTLHEVMTHFAPRLDPILTERRRSIDAFVAALAADVPSLAPLAERVARFADVKGPIPLTVIPIADPSPGGRAFATTTRGRMLVEIEEGSDPLPTFEHAFFYALMLKRRESLAVAAAKCKSEIDEETLTQAIAYALAPGLLHGGATGSDPLARDVDAHRAANRTLRSPIVRYERLALALRPMLNEAISGEAAFSAFLPRACDAWIAMAGR